MSRGANTLCQQPVVKKTLPASSIFSNVCFCLQRQMILTGCVAFARHVGPTRVEAELLPQCWEQVEYMPTGVIKYTPTEFHSFEIILLIYKWSLILFSF